MRPSVRVLDTGVKPSRWNIAMTAALTELHRLGHSPDTLRFHRYVPSVLIGRLQHAPAVLQHVELARRVTGGGAVYMDPGILAWDLIAARTVLGSGLERAAERVSAAVAAGLSSLGAAAEFRPPNDVLMAGLKVSGSSGSFQGATVVLQGTVILACDISAMADALAIPAATLRRHVGSLADILGRKPSDEDVTHALLGGLARLGLEFREGALAAHELELAGRLLEEEIGTDAFVLGDGVPELEPA
jgi:lipoate-protein ligase A